MQRRTAGPRRARRKAAVRDAHENTSNAITSCDAKRVQQHDGSSAVGLVDKGALEAAKSKAATGDSASDDGWSALVVCLERS